MGGLGTSLPLLLDRGSAAPEDDKPVPGHSPYQEDGEHGHLEENSSTIGDIEFGEARLDPTVFASTFDYGHATTMADGTVVREWDIVAELPAIRCPVLALQGADDEYGTPKQLAWIAGAVSGPVDTLLIPKCAHIPHFQARQTVMNALTEFVRRHA